MIAPPIGYPIAYPKVNPIGFGSPDPVPDTRSRFSASVFLSSINHPSPNRSVTRCSLPARKGKGKC
jgi:hypothetical protein